jgi:hypothetical protein
MVSAGAALAGVGAAAAFALSEAVVGTISLIIMVALATKARFILRNEYLADLRESTGVRFGSNKVRFKSRGGPARRMPAPRKHAVGIPIATSTLGANVTARSDARAPLRLPKGKLIRFPK